MTIDGSSSITIVSLALPAHAFIDAIRQQDTYDGTWYSIYPEGQQGACHIGSTARIDVRLRNNGTGAGIVYIKATMADTGAVIFEGNYSLAVNAYIDLANLITFVMGPDNRPVRIEIGHY